MCVCDACQGHQQQQEALQPSARSGWHHSDRLAQLAVHDGTRVLRPIVGSSDNAPGFGALPACAPPAMPRFPAVGPFGRSCSLSATRSIVTCCSLHDNAQLSRAAQSNFFSLHPRLGACSLLPHSVKQLGTVSSVRIRVGKQQRPLTWCVRLAGRACNAGSNCLGCFSIGLLLAGTVHMLAHG